MKQQVGLKSNVYSLNINLIRISLRNEVTWDITKTIHVVIPSPSSVSNCGLLHSNDGNIIAVALLALVAVGGSRICRLLHCG